MAVRDDTQAAVHDSAEADEQPVMIKSYKDALCFALDAKAVLFAATEVLTSAELRGIAGLMERLCRDMHDVMHGPAEARRNMARELYAIGAMTARINQQDDEQLLYTVETLIDLTIARLHPQVEVQHG